MFSTSGTERRFTSFTEIWFLILRPVRRLCVVQMQMWSSRTTAHTVTTHTHTHTGAVISSDWRCVFCESHVNKCGLYVQRVRTCSRRGVKKRHSEELCRSFSISCSFRIWFQDSHNMRNGWISLCGLLFVVCAVRATYRYYCKWLGFFCYCYQQDAERH